MLKNCIYFSSHSLLSSIFNGRKHCNRNFSRLLRFTGFRLPSFSFNQRYKKNTLIRNPCLSVRLSMCRHFATEKCMEICIELKQILCVPYWIRPIALPRIWKYFAGKQEYNIKKNSGLLHYVTIEKHIKLCKKIITFFLRFCLYTMVLLELRIFLRMAVL